MSMPETKFSQEAELFKKFIFNSFLMIVQELEVVLTDPKYQSQLAQINFFVTCLLDWLQSILKKNSQLSILVGMALMEKNKSKTQMLHRCEDVDYSSRVSNTNQECSCQLVDLVMRYSSLFSPKLQVKLYTILLDY